MILSHQEISILLCPYMQFVSLSSNHALTWILQHYRLSMNIQDSFTCLSSGLIYCISCRRCPAIYIGETGRTLRERFGEHLRSINKNAPGFPVAEHFSSNGHTAADALVRGIKLCDGNKQRKRQEMRLIFRLGSCQPRGLNADFQFI